MTRIAKFVILTLNIAAIVLLLMSAGAQFVSPASIGSVAELNLFFPIFVVTNLVFIVVWLFFNWKYSIFSLVALLLTFGSFQKTFSLHKQNDSETARKTLKIITYNVMTFDGYKRETPVLDFLNNSDADILFLQEVGWFSNNPNFLQKQDILQKLNKYPYYYLHNADKKQVGKNYGTGVFSKYPLKLKHQFVFENSFNSACVLNVNVDGDTLCIANCHLESNQLTSSDRKDLVENTADRELLDRTFRKIHLTSKLRAIQADTISAYLRAQKYPVVLCGDFNDTAMSYTYRTLAKGMNDAFVGSGAGGGFTFYEHFFRFRIDFVLTSPELHGKNLRVGTERYSDHRPVFCEISINN